MIGFRGPLDDIHKVPVLFLKPKGPDDAPEKLNWTYIDVSTLPGIGEERERGIRGMERLPGTVDALQRYLVVLGHSGSRHDQLRLAVWEPHTSKLIDLGAMPNRFVGEGIAVIESLGKDEYKILVVSDLEGRVMIKNIKLP